MKLLLSILSPPKFESPEKTRHGGYVYFICLAMFVGYLLLITYDQLFGIRAISYILYISEFSVAVTFIINNKGFIRLAMVLVLLINLFAITIIMLLSDGIHDEIIILFPAILFISCLLFDYRILLGTFIIVLLIIWTIGILEINRVLMNNFSSSTSLMQLIFITLMLTLSLFVINFLVEDSKRIIKEFKQKTVELEIANNKLNESNLTKDKFVSILAHDLRSPFQGLLGISNILEFEDADLSESERKDFISRLNKTLNRQYNFLEELLLWGRIQQGVVDFIPRNYNVRSLVDDNIDILSGNIEAKNLIIKIEGSETTEAVFDDKLISTVIRNLLSNAIKFTPVGGSIKIIMEDYLTYICLKITDTGIGMSLARQKALFTLEKNSSTRGTNDEPGSGLGLILCKEIISKHYGQLLVESEEGRGSSFTIILPKNTNIF